jgi:hypothetical protein
VSAFPCEPPTWLDVGEIANVKSAPLIAIPHEIELSLSVMCGLDPLVTASRDRGRIILAFSTRTYFLFATLPSMPERAGIAIGSTPYAALFSITSFTMSEEISFASAA